MPTEGTRDGPVIGRDHPRHPTRGPRKDPRRKGSTTTLPGRVDRCRTQGTYTTVKGVPIPGKSWKRPTLHPVQTPTTPSRQDALPSGQEGSEPEDQALQPLRYGRTPRHPYVTTVVLTRVSLAPGSGTRNETLSLNVS